MPGLIPHLIAGLTTAIIVHVFHSRFEFSASVFLGNLIPDVIKFGLSAIFQGTFFVFAVEKDQTYQLLNSITSNITNWMAMGFVIFAICGFLYHHHIIKKKTMEEYDELFGFFIVGVVTHLIMDLLIFEKGPWF